MVYFNFAEHLHPAAAPVQDTCDYCGAPLPEASQAYFDDVTSHEFCCVECGARYLSTHTPS